MKKPKTLAHTLTEPIRFGGIDTSVGMRGTPALFVRAETGTHPHRIIKGKPHPGWALTATRFAATITDQEGVTRHLDLTFPALDANLVRRARRRVETTGAVIITLT